MNAIDYGQMVRDLMMAPQLVGDVIPFQRRQGLMAGPEMGGKRGGYGGGGSVVPFGRRPTDKQKYNRALKEQSFQRDKGTEDALADAARGIRAGMTPEQLAQIFGPVRTPNTAARDYEMVTKQWHANTPNMDKALQKLTPAEVNKLFDLLFKAPPGVEFP